MKRPSTRVRAVAYALAFVSLLGSEALAQPGIKLPKCKQSMIEGTWQTYFNALNGGYDTEEGLLMNFVCAVKIAADGTVTTNSCPTFPSFEAVIELPSGKVIIDSDCYVTGSISYNLCNTGGTCNDVQLSISAWR